jgi:hypothetical protein
MRKQNEERDGRVWRSTVQILRYNPSTSDAMPPQLIMVGQIFVETTMFLD